MLGKYLQLQAATQLEPVNGVQDEATIDDFVCVINVIESQLTYFHCQEMLEPAAFNDAVPHLDDPGEIPAVESTGGRPVRLKKKTWKLQKAALALPPRIRQCLLPEPEPMMEEPSAESTVVCTPTNTMGLYRIYP